jgi:hypothetical protein
MIKSAMVALILEAAAIALVAAMMLIFCGR